MSSNCPICDKEFPVEQIEIHVEKCLFLNTQAPNEFNKRQANHQDDFGPTTSFSSTPKRAKSVSLNGTFQENNSPNTSRLSWGGEKQEKQEKPLAERMRPNNLHDYIGQEHVLGDNMAIRNLLEKNQFPSMILWGPPGCGKTTLANIIQKKCQECKTYRFVKMSATQAGVNDVKELVNAAKNDLQMLKRSTVLFMDEIHRFNKLQQDIFLPNVESGIITLIGATTENPSFSLNNALLSRCRVIVLRKLEICDIEKILQRATGAVGAFIENENGTQPTEDHKYKISNASLKWLAEISDGDARIALNSLQLALDSAKDQGGLKNVTLEDIKQGVMRSHLLYDRKGEEHYNIISALHKSIRASHENAALYWLTRMLEGGEDPLFVARRLVRAASEDIGLADPLALGLAVTAMQGCQLIGMPECNVLLAQTAVYLARAPKSTEVYKALCRAQDNIKNHKGPLPSVPLHLRNAPTRLMKDLGYAKGYNMRHKDESNLEYMPEGMENVNFF